MEVKRIYKITLASYLVDHGCKLLNTVPDLANPKRKNWIFEDTPELEELISIYTKKIKREV